ncbi:TniQ family protein [Herbaspirillum camelliae]|uniref:TniQ family protein n=1 Tax=Herbaspirillum camelliae TaxID=1892903 RepID=UPI000949F10F|nr:TniQ family protein [Herbaspirillum camelliae]
MLDAGSENDAFSWSAPDLPENLTRLYRLVPANEPTWGREGLISFIVRLSRAHSVNPRLLIQKVFCEAEPKMARILKNRFYVKDSRTINAVGEYGRLFAQITSQLTGHGSLDALTMLPWQHVLPENGEAMTAKHVRWCSGCLAEQALILGFNYRPLIWSLDPYKSCWRHQRPLQDHCPRCDNVQPFIPSVPVLGHCVYCGASLLTLSSSIPAENVDATQFKLEASLWEMLEGSLSEEPSLEAFKTNLRLLIHQRADGNKARFCADLGWDQWAANAWLLKGQRPTLQRLAALSLRHDISIPALFTKPMLDVQDAECLPGIEFRKAVRKARPQFATEDRQRIAEQLANELSSTTPRSLNAIGKALDIRRSALKYWFPELHRQLVARYRAFRMQEAILAKSGRNKILEEILVNLVKNGIRPSKRIVDKKLSEHGLALVREDLAATYRFFMTRLEGSATP